MKTLRPQLYPEISKFNCKLTSLAILTSCASPFMFMSSVNAAEVDDDIVIEAYYENLQPELTVEDPELTAEDPELTVEDYMACADLKYSAARLACYDKVTLGQEVTIGRKKNPIDITESVKATFTELRPQAVYAGDRVVENNNKNASDPGAPTKEGNEKLANAGITVDDYLPYTRLSMAYDLDRNSEQGTWTVRPHNPIYLMPAFAHYDPNRRPSTPTQSPTDEDFAEYHGQYDDSLELKTQISLKTKVSEDIFDTNADVWFGYTQQMHWQVYNEDNSRPFRATDYMPEIFITLPVAAELPFNGRLRMLGAGAIHHSNGQSDPWSRSWNRVYLMGGAEWGKFTFIPKVWTHVKNESGSTPSDNPDITDYYGHGEIVAIYDFGRGETLSATGRYNFDTEKGAIQVDYTQPLTRDLHAFIQVFHGYGESIIDYNDETTAVGVGVSLNDWRGL